MTQSVPLISGLIAALAAVLAAGASVVAATLDREAGPIEAPTNYLLVSTPEGNERRQMWFRARSLIAAGCKSAQAAAAGFTVASAFLFFVSAFPDRGMLTTALGVLGGIIMLLSTIALTGALTRRGLPAARDAFDRWYIVWVRGYISAGETPQREETAKAFMGADPRNALILRRFKQGPFQ